MSGSVLISFCLDNCSTISTATLCYILHQSHSKLRHIQNYVYSGTCRNIQAFLALLRHIQAYSGIFSTLCNRHILTTAPYSEPWHIYKQSHIYSKPCETLTRLIQNPTIVRTVYSSIIQPYSEPCVSIAHE